jgi:ABC-type polysaccharide/polyol phosphate transport system, ATPase component
MNDTVIKVENLSKLYRLGSRESYKTIRESIVNAFRKKHNGHEPSQEELWALKDVSFEVQRGEIVGIIGRNGAGKSTLLKIIARITEPTTGRIEMRGRVGSLLEVGTGFHPELTGHENIYLYGAILGMNRYEVTRKFDEIIAFSELERFVKTPVKKYSSGMYMRLAFAVAAHLEPEILLVDEVLAVGDVQFQKKCLGKMDDVSKSGRTVLFVSHNMPSIQRLCTSCILLEKGLVKNVGMPNNVIEQYLSTGIDSAFSWKREKDCNEDAFFERLFICDEKKREIGFLKSDDAMSVCIEFAIVKPYHDLQMPFCLLGKNEEVIFTSVPQDAGVSIPMVPGTYRSVITLPKDLLMAQNYSIAIALMVPKIRVFDRLDLRFSVQEADSFSSRLPMERGGEIAVKCDWELLTP